MFTLIGFLVLGMLGVAVLIVGTVLLVIWIARLIARGQTGDTARRQ